VIRGIRADNANFESFLLPLPAQTGNHKGIAISFDYLRSNKLFCALVERRLTHLRACEARLTEFAGFLGKPI
jgi:hypothetical protein